MTDEPSRPELAAELEDLRARLAEAEDVLRAIRNGEVDALVVTGKRGEQVYTLTEQKLHEQIVTAERQARLILEQVAEAVVVCDEQCRVIRISQAALRFCDGSPILRPFAEVFPLRTDAFAPFHIAPVFQGQALRNVDVVLDRHGHKLHLLVNAGPLLGGLEILGCVVTLTDITERKRAEEQIELLSRFPSENPNPVLRVSAQGILGYANAASDILLPAIGAEVGGVVNAEWQAHIDEAIAKAHPVNIDFQVGDRTFGVTLVSVEDLGYVNLYTRDITERKRADEALKLFRALVDQSSDVIEVLDPETGRFLDVNERGCLDHGYSREEYLALRVFDIDPTVNQSAFTKVAEDLRDANVLQWEGIHRRKDGSTFPVEVNLKYVRLDRDYMVSVVRDMTERRRTEEAHARLATAVEQSPETIMITDVNATILYVNPSFERITGYAREEAIGQNPRILKSGKQDVEFYRRMWDVLTRNEMWSGHLIDRRKDGILFEEDVSISPVRDAAGKVINYVAVKRDVTHEAQLEAQLRQAQKMEAVGRLAGGVAHDFNNMLQIIIVSAGMALEDAAPESELHELLEEVLKAGHRSADMTRQLLAFARKQTIAPIVLDLNEIVASMLKMLGRLIGEDIDLLWKPGNNLGQIKMDPAQIDQILANLVVNARDAIAGVGTVTIETENAEFDDAYCEAHIGSVPGMYAMLAVSDDGCGMDKETRASIFEPFFTTKEQGKGTGLGLATVYGIVKQNNGFINVYSEPGQGTTFKIYVPRCEAETPAGGSKRESAELPRGTETILLVEDEEAVLRLGKRLLEHLGYTVLAACSPSKAVQLAEGHAGDLHLVLTDVVMPEMSGRDLWWHLDALRPGLKCLYMSGYTANVIAHQGVLDEGVHFLEKPFSVEALAAKVRETLDA